MDRAIAGTILTIIFMIAATLILPFHACPKKWAASGLTAEFSLLTGCMVKRKDGSVVPEAAIRDVSL